MRADKKKKDKTSPRGKDEEREEKKEGKKEKKNEEKSPILEREKDQYVPLDSDSL